MADDNVIAFPVQPGIQLIQITDDEAEAWMEHVIEELTPQAQARLNDVITATTVQEMNHAILALMEEITSWRPGPEAPA